jgi:hypothetical protein
MNKKTHESDDDRLEWLRMMLSAIISGLIRGFIDRIR